MEALFAERLVVGLSPEWSAIRRDFGQLLQIAYGDEPPLDLPMDDGWHSATATPTSATSLTSEPLAAARDGKAAALLAPIPPTAELPPLVELEELKEEAIRYVRGVERDEEDLRGYVGLQFEEYRKRRAIDQKWETKMESMAEELADARRREIPLEVRQALEALGVEETTIREQTNRERLAFVEWVEQSTPQWLEAVHHLEEDRVRREAERATALAAAKAALAEELAAAGLEGVAAGALLLGMEPPAMGLEAAHDANDPASELRLKAIAMLEKEEAEVRERRATQLQRVRIQEDQLRAQIAGREAQRKHQEEEREADRQMMLEHLQAEEQLLRARMREKEQQQEALAELAREQAAKEKEAHRQRLCEEEAAIRARLAQQEAIRQEEAARVTRIEEQKEALRQAAEAKVAKEKEEQLAYLREQEAIYQSRCRAHELDEIRKAEEQRRLQYRPPVPAVPMYAPAPQPTYAYMAPSAPAYGYPGVNYGVPAGAMVPQPPPPVPMMMAPMMHAAAQPTAYYPYYPPPS